VTQLHVGVACAHVFVEGGLDEGEGFLELSLVGGAAGEEDLGGGGPFAVGGEGDEGFGGDESGGLLEVGDGGVEVLGVAGVGDPDGSGAAEDVGEPEDLGGEVVMPLLRGGVVEDEDALLEGEVAGGDWDGLAVAGLDELELALVEGLADGVVDEAFGEGLLERGDGFGEGLGEGGGYLSVERGVSAVGELDSAVDDVGVGAGG
jgi:hypothetical protein